jgi:hypothetical protein
MFVWLRVQGFESSVNKVFQKEKLINSKTIKDLQSSKRKLVQPELIWFRLYHPLDGITNPKHKLLHFLTDIDFYKEKNARALNQDRCCHLALCLADSLPL